MTYYIDAEYIYLDDLRKRIEGTDLVPSRACLLEGIAPKFEALAQQGITTLAGLRYALKNPKRLGAVSEATGIDSQYLVLLRREFEGYFPGPFALKAFDWLPKEEIAKLEACGIGDTAAYYQAARRAEYRAALAESTGAAPSVLEALFHLSDLTRVQWVSPTAARMLVDASYDSASKLAAANAEELCERLAQINQGNIYFKGKIGLRDVRRLIYAAGYIPG